MRTDYLKVAILSPVHIGTGDTVDPFHYLIEDRNGAPVCHFIDPAAWAAEHPDPDELLKQFSGGNIAQMRAYLAEQLDPALYADRSCKVVSRKVVDDYHKHLGSPESRNQLLLSPNLTGGGGGPLLPGSSLKGAIRTALVDWLDREENLQLKQCQTNREREQRLERFLGKITDNSFQGLKLADCEAARNSSLIVEAREIRRNPEKNVTPKANCEVLASRLLGATDDSTLATRLVLGCSRPNEQSACLRLKNGRTFNWEQLAELVNAYSRQRYLEEKKKFWELPHFSQAKQALAAIEPLILQPPRGAMVLKVGHYSQIEYVTVKNNRPFTRKTKDDKRLPHGTTRTLADGIYPFGWIMLTPCSEQEYMNILAARDKRNREILQRQENERAQRRAALQRQLEQRRQKRLAEEKAREERKRRELEEAQKPWLAWIRALDQVRDWGSLKQFLEKEEPQSHREQPELAKAVKASAERVRAARPDKWSEERLSLVNDWLRASGMELKTASEEQSAADIPEDVSQIEVLRDFGAYQQAGLDITSLSKPALKLLQQKMKSWGCDKKTAKKNKQKVYHAVSQALRTKNR